MTLQMKGKILEPIAGDMLPEQKIGSRRRTRQRWKSGGKPGRSDNVTWLNRIQVRGWDQDALQ